MAQITNVRELRALVAILAPYRGERLTPALFALAQRIAKMEAPNQRCDVSASWIRRSRARAGTSSSGGRLVAGSIGTSVIAPPWAWRVAPVPAIFYGTSWPRTI